MLTQENCSLETLPMESSWEENSVPWVSHSATKKTKGNQKFHFETAALKRTLKVLKTKWKSSGFKKSIQYPDKKKTPRKEKEKDKELENEIMGCTFAKSKPPIQIKLPLKTKLLKPKQTKANSSLSKRKLNKSGQSHLQNEGSLSYRKQNKTWNTSLNFKTLKS